MNKLFILTKHTRTQQQQQPTKEVPREQPLNYLTNCMFNGPREIVEHKIQDGKRYRRCQLSYNAHWSRGERFWKSEFLNLKELEKRGCPPEGLNGWRLIQPSGPILGTIFGNHPAERCPLATGEWVEMD